MTDHVVGHRNQYLDILKGIAAFMVILGRCIQYGSGFSYREAEHKKNYCFG